MNSETTDLIKVVNIFTLYSPIMVIIAVLFYSVISYSSNKGFIYLLICTIGILGRAFIFSLIGNNFKNQLIYDNIEENQLKANICKNFVFIVKENMLLSIFIMSFTFIYMLIPMIMSKSLNLGFIILFLLFISFDIGYKYHMGCYKTYHSFIKLLLLDLTMGIILAVSTVSLLYLFGGYSLLFFSVTEKGERLKCEKKNNNQELKCDVYKNGELIKSNIST